MTIVDGCGLSDIGQLETAFEDTHRSAHNGALNDTVILFQIRPPSYQCSEGHKPSSTMLSGGPRRIHHCPCMSEEIYRALETRPDQHDTSS